MQYYFKCPQCRHDEEFHFPSEQRSDLGCALLIFGGIIPALIYADSRRHRVQCGACRHIFRQPPPPRTSVSLLAHWVFWTVVVFAAVVVFLMAFPEVIPDLSKYPIVLELESFVATNPRAVVLSVVPLMGGLVILMPIVSVISNLRGRASLRKQFKTRPTSYFELPTDSTHEPRGSAQPTEGNGR